MVLGRMPSPSLRSSGPEKHGRAEHSSRDHQAVAPRRAAATSIAHADHILAWVKAGECGAPRVPIESHQNCECYAAIRGTWKVDGLACYFDPFLEAEALGCKREWHSDESCELACPSFLGADDLRETCGALDAISRKGQIPVACDVLQRLKVMLKDEPALMVRVTGPLTLALQLSGEQMQARNTASLLSQDLVEFASEVTAAVSKSFLEAGADVVFLRESFFPEMATELYGRWASLLAPIVNVIRFYEALPVLLLGDSALARVELASVVNRTWEGIWCPVLSCDVSHWGMWRSHGATPCLGLPSAVFGQSHDLENSITSIKELVASQKPLLLTSRGDISATVDVKTFATVLGSVREALLVGGSNRV